MKSLMQYIQGSRKGKEAHRLEKEAMKDPFLSDALDGFQAVKGNHVESIEECAAGFPTVPVRTATA